MAPARDDRYDDVEQLAVALTAVMSDSYEPSSSEATELDAALETARPPRRQSQRRLIGAATVASLVVLSVWVTSTESPPLRTGSAALPSKAATREAGVAVAPPLLSGALPQPNPDLVPAVVSAAVEQASGDVVGKARVPRRPQPADAPTLQARSRRPSEEPSSPEEPAPASLSPAIEGGDDPLIRRGYVVESPYASSTELDAAAKSPEAE
jgi:hypothetical protein